MRSPLTNNRQALRTADVKRAVPRRAVKAGGRPGSAMPRAKAVLRAILDLRARGVSLRRDDVVRDYPELEHRAKRCFGDWSAAVEAAGLAGRVYERWDQARVVDEILQVHNQGGSLAHSRAPSRLVEAAITHFGSWRGAVEGAGLDYVSIRLPTRIKQPPKQLRLRGKARNSIEDVLAMLREAANSGRTGIGPRGFITQRQAAQVRRWFGSTRAGLQAAGLDPAVVGLFRRYDSDEAIAAALRQLMMEEPKMTLETLGRHVVGQAVKRRHGSLATGLPALGFSDWPRRQKFPLPSRAEVVAAILERHRVGASMVVSEVMPADRRLVKAVYKHFGTWRSAMRAAGLVVETQAVTWDRARLRAELQGRHLRGEAVDAAAIRRDDPTLWSGIVESYGDLKAALRDIARARRRSARRNAKRRSAGGKS